ncbi:hypothetical protein [Aporhodopirellula aestuarii]|uniref:Cytochrome oxidase complex assembly protein 1 n=1 Tax=Aporhodopirellula aestuarii TaxID=2950107 RepID=A0ABT0U8U5_9BACT|nr:hypothetical protein [Aporhodopirellula aestuarii]MCM2372955.1 hypothetical protein [Aporhodopirellula aestuarii]
MMSNDPLKSGNHTDGVGVAGNEPGVAAPKKNRRTCLWIAGIVIGGGLFSLIVCCGVGLYLVQNYGSSIFEPVRGELNQLADLRSEVGNIESLSMNVFATVDEGKSNPDFMILDGKAEQRDFQVSVKMTNAGELQKVFLVMPDGSRKPISLDNRVGSTTVVPSPDSADDDQEATAGAAATDAASDETLDPTELEIRELESELDLD